MSRASIYQQLRAHLTYLKLTAAAEALPAALDRAKRQDRTTPSSSTTSSLSRLTRPKHAVSPDGSVSPTSRPHGNSTTSTSPPNPQSTKH